MRAYWLNAQENLDLPVADLERNGVTYARVPVEACRAFLDRVKSEQGYVAEDEVELTPSTPNLEALLAKFDREHLHSDDEVRYVLDGAGIFDIRSKDGCWMRVTVEPGDFIIVPKERYHLFRLLPGGSIKTIRLFRDTSGWTPQYR